MSSNYFASIQTLRGLASLMVVIYHIFGVLGYGNLPILNGGVDLFFVISGFVMVVSTQDKRGEFASFIWSRLIRIVPLYWITTAVMVCILQTGLYRASPGWDEVVKSLLFISYFDAETSLVQPVLGVGWTLNLEFIFYALFAATMYLRVVHQVVVLGFVFCCAVAIRIISDPTENSVLFFYTTPMLLEFVIGMMIGASDGYLRKVNELAGIGLVVAAVVLTMFLGLTKDIPRTLDQGVPAAMFLAGSVILERYFRVVSVAPLRALGDFSYSLYLSHPILLLLASPLVTNWEIGLALPVLTISCLLVGFATYHYLERPMGRVGRREKIALISQPPSPRSNIKSVP